MHKTLSTPRLILRPWREPDSVDLYDYARSPLVGPEAGWPPHKSEEESREIIRTILCKENIFALELKEGGKVIGGAGLHPFAPEPKWAQKKQKEMGYVLHPGYWGQGYATEAARALIEYGFAELGLDLIWCSHHVENQRSRRVIEKCGFRFYRRDNREMPQLGGAVRETRFYVREREVFF